MKRDSVKQVIAYYLLRKGQLKLTLRGMETLGEPDEHSRNKILDEIIEINEMLEKLYAALKELND